MKKISIRLSSTGKIYLYEPKNSEGEILKLKIGDPLLVETDRIIEESRVVAEGTLGEEGAGTILKKIGEEERKFCEELKHQAAGYIEEAQIKADRHGLPMKIQNADLSYDQKKLTFYFSAKGRIDFRGLVLDLAKTFNKLIRLQQVSSREEAKYFGGIGKCGRELCCRRFLENPEQTTLEMAELQDLHGAGTTKLSGCCGKLMCCLSFEVKNYDQKEKKEMKESSQ